MVKFVHTADWQLGMRRYYLDEDAQARHSQARVDVIAGIGDLVSESGAAFVVVAGDVFEDNQVQRRVVWRALEAMGSIQVPVYLLPGNHDPLNAGSIFVSREFVERCPSNVVVLTDARPVEVTPGVEVVGAPWPSKRPLEDLCALAADGLEPAAGTIRVLVGHGAVDYLSPDTSDPARIRVSRLEQALDEGRVAYVALGDRHSTTRVGSSGRIWYSGAPEPTDFVETDAGNALVVEIGADSFDVAAHPVGTWRFVDRQFHLEGDEAVPEVSRWLDEVEDPARAAVRLSFVGSLSLRGRAQLDSLLADAGETFGAVDIAEQHSDLAVVADDADVRELDLRGFARDATEVLSGRVVADSGDQEASDALRLLYRLAREVA